MKIRLGQSRKIELDGKMVRAIPTAIQYTQGRQVVFFREVWPPHNSYWYDTKARIKTSIPQ
jgi:hypothetical protein